MKTKFILGSLAILASSQAAIADTGDRSTQTISVSAAIPSASFSVAPLSGNWPSNVSLNYDGTAFTEYTLVLSANASNKLTAGLTNIPELTNGSDSLPMVVKMDNVTLDQSLQEVLPVATASATTLSITATGTPTNTGQVYNGSVALIFEDTL